MEKLTPRSFQKTAISQATQAIRTSGKALVVMATGLGKTLTSAWTMKRVGTLPGLFLVHNNDILDRAMKKEYARVFPGLTLKIFNGKNKDVAGADIVFATLQTMQRNLSSFKPNHFKWLVFDESHHAHARTFKKVVSHFTCSKLALTATPNRMDLRDIRELFGQEVVNISLEEAIARGWLPPIEYHLVTDDSLNERYLEQLAEQVLGQGQRIPLEQIKKRLFVKTREKKIASIIQSHNEKTAVFCQNIQHANRFARLLKNVTLYHSGKKRDDNVQALEDLRNGLAQQICVVNAFNEGIDIPDIGLVVFSRATQSETIFRQQLGRGLRPGKKKLIVLDFVGNIERIRMIKKIVKKIVKIHDDITDGPGTDPGRRRRNPLIVSGKGFEFTFSKQIVDIERIFDRLEEGYTQKNLLEFLLRESKRLGRSPTKEEVTERSKEGLCPSPGTFAIYFGSFSAALKAAGLEFKIHQKWSADNLIAHLRSLAKELGKSPGQKDVDRARTDGKPGSTAYYRMFGSWSKALKEARLESRRKTGKELIVFLKLKRKEYKRIPTNSDVADWSRNKKGPSEIVFINRFGSWQNALKAAGMEKTRFSSFNQSDLIKCLITETKQLGRIPEKKDMELSSKAKRTASYPTFIKAFGNWHSALKSAGLTK